MGAGGGWGGLASIYDHHHVFHNDDDVTHLPIYAHLSQ